MNIYKIIRIPIWLLIIFMSYKIIAAVLEPINFSDLKLERYTKVIDKLNEIRDAQIIHKSVKKKYAKNFDELTDFIENGQIPLLARREVSYTKYDPVYRIDVQIEETVIDTLGFVPVRDSLYKGGDEFKTLRYIPFTDNKEFSIKTSRIAKNGVYVDVFEVKAKKRDVLSDQPLYLLKQEDEAIDVRGAFIQLGSLEELSLNGNWAKIYESSFQAKSK